jgi:hypothetical protein
MTQDLKKLHKQLLKVESNLDKCRTTVIIDGWQTQKHSKKSRNWDFYSQQKIKILGLINDFIGCEFVLKSDSIFYKHYGDLTFKIIDFEESDVKCVNGDNTFCFSINEIELAL